MGINLSEVVHPTRDETVVPIYEFLSSLIVTDAPQSSLILKYLSMALIALSYPKNNTLTTYLVISIAPFHKGGNPLVINVPCPRRTGYFLLTYSFDYPR